MAREIYQTGYERCEKWERGNPHVRRLVHGLQNGVTGLIPPQPPLPSTATSRELSADLARIRAQAARHRQLVMAVSIVWAVVMLIVVMVGM